jgi:pimeloyl-ACP methyl ester carboxylesterase
VSAQLLLEIVRFDEEDTLGSIRLPTTVIVGDHDLMTPVAQARAMVAAIPGARLLLLPGCGHMVMLERRREVDEALAGGRPAWQVA